MATRPALRLIEGGAGRTPRIGSAVEFAALGAGLTLTFALLGTLPSWYHGLAAFQSLFVVAFGFYGLALLRLGRYAAIPRIGAVVFAVAFAIRAAVLPVPPSLSGDVFRYVWEGRVVVAGGDPYHQSPADPALAALRDREVWPRVNHPGLSTIYPPLAIAGYALVARIAPHVTAMKLWVTAHDLALILLLLAWTRRRRIGAAAVLAYAWNPLVAVEYAGSGHNDPTAMMWLVLALVLLDSRPVLSAASLAAGALVKLVPLLALPYLLRRWPWRARLLALALVIAGLGAYLSMTRDANSGLIVYWGTWRNNELLFHYLERWTGTFTRARAIGLALVAAVMAWAWWRRLEPARAARVAIWSAILTSPVLHPWYLGWALMFEPLAPSPPALLLSLTAILNYGVFATPAEGRGYHLPLAWRWVEYGIPLATAAVPGLLRWRRARRAREG